MGKPDDRQQSSAAAAANTAKQQYSNAITAPLLHLVQLVQLVQLARPLRIIPAHRYASALIRGALFFGGF
jgi:hypothetical protein